MNQLLAVLALVAVMSPSAQQSDPPAVVPAMQTAEAYNQFLLGRHLESRGDVAGARAALERAAELDPGSAEARAELAAFLAQQNELDGAIAAAEAALKIDPRNGEAHRVLGMIYSTRGNTTAQRDEVTRKGGTAAGDYIGKAIDHFERARERLSYDEGLQLSLARLYLRTLAFDKAIALLSPLNEQAPGSSDVVVMLARAYDGAGRRSDAIRTLEDSVADGPASYRSLTVLAGMYEQDGRWRDAAGVYARASAQNPRSIELKTRWASALFNSGDVAEARGLLRDAAATNPTDASTLYMLAQAERDVSDLDAAQSTAQRLVAMEPNEVRSVLLLAQVLAQRRDYKQAVTTLEPAIAAATTRSVQPRQLGVLLVHLGFAYQALQDHDRAISTFETARSVSPPDVSFEIYIVQAQVAARRFAAAIEHADWARAKYPGDIQLARLEAQALRRTGQGERGVAILEEALRAHEDEATAFTALAEAYSETGHGDKAVALLEQAMTKFSTDPMIPFGLGAALERQKRHADAERAFRQVLALDRMHAPTLNYLGYMLAERGERLEESVDFIRRALDIDPYNGSYLDSLGWAYFKLNKLDLAETNLVRAATQISTNSVVQDHLGELMFKLGRYDDAVEAWKRALAGDGESIERAEIERKLKQAQQKAKKK